MSILHAPSIPLHVSPSVRKAVAELGVLLDEYGYSPTIRESICRYTAANGTPTGAPGLDPEDEHDAELVFVAELEPVPFDSPAWDRDTSVILDAGMLADGTHPFPIPTVGDDDRAEPDDFAAAALEDLTLPPVCGGGPDDDGPEFIPTESDWEDYCNHFDEVEVRYGYE
jgi:hypothetical protein